MHSNHFCSHFSQGQPQNRKSPTYDQVLFVCHLKIKRKKKVSTDQKVYIQVDTASI